MRGQACSWLCGAGASGSAAIDLGALADGPHALTVYAQSYADAGASVGPIAFSVDRNAPAQPQIHVAPDPAAAASGWWGHGPIALTLATATAADVTSSRLRVYGPSGAVVLDQTLPGPVTAASLPATTFAVDGAYELDVLQCDAADHCTASPRAGLHWDGTAPPALVDGFAPPLGTLAARDGAHLTWPALVAAAGGSGIAGGFAGIGPTPASARAQSFAAARWEAGVPGASETSIPPASVHGATQVCLAVRPVSGAGIAAASAGVRCASVDELVPDVTLSGTLAWSGGPQTVALAVSDASGAAFAEVLLDGVPVAAPGDALTIGSEGAHVVRALARDGAGNETVVERSLGVDTSGRRSVP